MFTVTESFGGQIVALKWDAGVLVDGDGWIDILVLRGRNLPTESQQADIAWRSPWLPPVPECSRAAR